MLLNDICYCASKNECDKSKDCLRATTPEGIYTNSYLGQVCHAPDYSYFLNEGDFLMNYESEDKMVSHPDHYQSSTGLEVIDVIEAFTEGLEGIEATDTGNIIKYACRWKDKNGKQDLEKIIWYTQHLINHLEEKEND